MDNFRFDEREVADLITREIDAEHADLVKEYERGDSEKPLREVAQRLLDYFIIYRNRVTVILRDEMEPHTRLSDEERRRVQLHFVTQGLSIRKTPSRDELIARGVDVDAIEKRINSGGEIGANEDDLDVARAMLERMREKAAPSKKVARAYAASHVLSTLEEDVPPFELHNEDGFIPNCKLPDIAYQALKRSIELQYAGSIRNEQHKEEIIEWRICEIEIEAAEEKFPVGCTISLGRDELRVDRYEIDPSQDPNQVYVHFKPIDASADDTDGDDDFMAEDNFMTLVDFEGAYLDCVLTRTDDTDTE